jgi:hypothetical protein
MRVRVWIAGAEGPSHDFELLSAPRVSERISIAIGGQTEEGVVSSVSWQLQGMERSEGDLALDGEPTGSVSIVHVICSPTAEVVQLHHAAAEVDTKAAGGPA